MKKLISIIGAIVLIILITLSCEKQFEEEDSLKSPSYQVIQTSQNTEQRILAFKEIIGSNLKSGSELCIDSAVWYTEAAVNYDYADVTNDLMGLDIDSAFISVSLTNGKVTTSEAADVYDKIVDSLTVQYGCLPANAHLIFADVFSRDSVAGSVTFGLIGAFGYGPAINFGSFDEDDWWMFGWSQYNNGGYCGESQYYGTHTDDDAAKQIERRIRAAIGYQSGRWYPTDVITMRITPEGLIIIEGDPASPYYCNFTNPDDETEWDNYYDYLIFYNNYGWDNFHYCLCPDEMEFYWIGSSDVSNDSVYSCIPEVLGERDFISIEMTGDNTSGYPNYTLQHHLFNTYGIWVYTQYEPDSFE